MTNEHDISQEPTALEPLNDQNQGNDDPCPRCKVAEDKPIPGMSTLDICERCKRWRESLTKLIGTLRKEEENHRAPHVIEAINVDCAQIIHEIEGLNGPTVSETEKIRVIRKAIHLDYRRRGAGLIEDDDNDHILDHLKKILRILGRKQVLDILSSLYKSEEMKPSEYNAYLRLTGI